MINLPRCFHDRRLFQAVTGMNYAEFTALLPAFEESLNREQRPSKPARQRQEGGGRKHSLTTGREQLFFYRFLR